MKLDNKHDICPVEHAGTLHHPIRRLLQNPTKICRKYTQEGMSVLDFGCGPGYFTAALSTLVGSTGTVIAADIQPEMLELARKNTHKLASCSNIIFHQTKPKNIGLEHRLDFILAFYVVHEINDKHAFFNEIYNLLKPNGQFLMVEPLFHVDRKNWISTVELANKSGLTVIEKQKVFFSRGIAFSKT